MASKRIEGSHLLAPPFGLGDVPVLAEGRVLRFGTFTVLYAVQGACAGLFLYAFPPYLAERGFSAASIGSFAGITFLPWSLKLVAGPMMDRWTFMPMGRRRPWVLGGQVGVIVACVAASLIPEPVDDLSRLIVAGFTINFFIAFQDVAIDGMAIDLLPVGEQGRANGLMFGGQSLGNATVIIGGVWLMNASGPAAVFLLIAALTGLTLIMSLLLRERRGERFLPWSPGEAAEPSELRQGWRHIGRNLGRAVILPSSVAALVGLFAFRVGEGLTTTTLPVVAVQELGWSDTAFSQLRGTSDLVAALAGMMLFGVLGDRFGVARMAQVGALLVIILAGSMAFLSGLWGSFVVVESFVVSYLIANLLIVVVYMAMMMALCHRRVAATQFGMSMAVSNLGLSAGAALLGPTSAVVSYASVFLVVVGFYVAMLVAVSAVNLGRHSTRLAELDSVPAACTDWVRT